MSPQPAKVDRATIVTTAWSLVESAGSAEQVTLKALASALGIRAPSLYNHFRNKDALIRAINEHTEAQLYTAMQAAIDSAAGDHAIARMTALLHGYRGFALAHPAVYVLAFTTHAAEARPDPAAQEQAVLPYQALMAQISGEADSLPALRGALALAHGFVMLEIHGQLRRAGSLDAAFAQSVAAYLRGWPG